MADLTELQSTQGVKIAGADSTGLETGWVASYNSGQVNADLSYTTPGISFGDVATGALTTFAIQRTPYTEQTTNGQRSIASASALDTAAGTGAKTIILTYFDQTGVGPFTETLTLSGTTGVNTVSTTICFIESIVVSTVGSTGSNAGIITLYSAINKGGGTVWTIAATNNRTFAARHYVAVGSTAHITGINVGHSSTFGNNGSVWAIRSRPVNAANAVEVQISDISRLYGTSSSFSRSYLSPIKVVGPARITMYVTPETNNANICRGSFDYFEV